MKGEDIKKIYDTKVPEEYSGDYERTRWFGNSIQKKAYEMTRETILHVLPNITFTRYLEVGPGPGTWTKLFINKNNSASYVLVDISKEMLTIAKKNLGEGKNISYINTDAVMFDGGKKYDLFFSSRALEYIDDKKTFISRILGMLEKKGAGVIITKMPKYGRNRVLGRDIPPLHGGQIDPDDLANILKENGVRIVSILPVTFTFPFAGSPSINYFMFIMFGKRNLNSISRLFAESYCIFFKKI